LQFNKKHHTSTVKFYLDNCKLPNVLSGISNATQRDVSPFWQPVSVNV